MTYNELQKLCTKRKIQLKDVLEATGMTYVGLKAAFNNDSLTYRKILPLCECIGITPNELFGVTPIKDKTNSYEQIGLQNTQNIGTQNIGTQGIDILQQQLKIKDAQIDKLLNLLNK